MPLHIPDDELDLVRQQARNPRLNVQLTPKSPNPVDPSALVSQAVTGTPTLNLPRMNANVEQPEFDAKRSNLNQIMGVLGATATALSPDSTAGAIGSGLAGGAAQSQQDLVNTFLNQQEQAQAISQAIRQFNVEQETREAESQFEANVDRQRDLLDARQQRERDDRLHQQGLTDIETRESVDLKAQKALEKYKRGLPLTEEEERSLELEAFRAQTGRMREERLSSQDQSGGINPARIRRMLADTSRQLRAEQSLMPDISRMDEADEGYEEALEQQRRVRRLQAERAQLLGDLDRVGALNESERQEYLQLQFPNLYGEGGLVERGAQYRQNQESAQSASDVTVQDAAAAFQAGQITREEYEQVIRQLDQ